MPELTAAGPIGTSTTASPQEIVDVVFAGSAVAQAAAVADLNQDISASYVEAEVQAISDKVDALLAALRTAGLLAS